MAAPKAIGATLDVIDGQAAASGDGSESNTMHMIWHLERHIKHCQLFLQLNNDELLMVQNDKLKSLDIIQDIQKRTAEISDLQLQLSKLQPVPVELTHAPLSLLPAGFCAMPYLSDGHIRLFVTLLSGRILTIQISPSASLISLKNQIHEAAIQDGVAQSDQACLMFWGRRVESLKVDKKVDEFGISNDSVLHFVPPPPGKLRAQSSRGGVKGTTPISESSGKQFATYQAIASRVINYATLGSQSFTAASFCSGQYAKSPWNIDTLMTNLDDSEYSRACEMIKTAYQKVEDEACADFCQGRTEDKKIFKKAFSRKVVSGVQTSTHGTGTATKAPTECACDDKFDVDRLSADALHLWSCRFSYHQKFMQMHVPLKLSDDISHKVRVVGREINCTYSVDCSANQSRHHAEVGGSAINKHSSLASVSYSSSGHSSVLLPFSPERPFDHKYQKTTTPVWMYRFKNTHKESFEKVQADYQALKTKVHELAVEEKKQAGNCDACAAIESQMAEIIKQLKLIELELKQKKSQYDEEEILRSVLPFVHFPERVSKQLENFVHMKQSTADIRFEEKEALRYKNRFLCLSWKFNMDQMYAYCDPPNEDDPDIELRRLEVSWNLQKEEPFSIWSYRFLIDIVKFKKTDLLVNSDGPPFLFLPRPLSEALEYAFVNNQDLCVYEFPEFPGSTWKFNLKRMSATKMTGSEFECFPEMELQREQVSWDRPGNGQWTGEWVSMSPNESRCIETWYEAVGDQKTPYSEFEPESFLGGDQADHFSERLKVADRADTKDLCVRLDVKRGVSGHGDIFFFAHRHVCTSFRGDVLYQCAMWPHHILNQLNDDRMCSIVKPFDRNDLVQELWLSMRSVWFSLLDPRQNLEYRDRCITNQNGCDFLDCSYCLHKKNFHDIQHLFFQKIHPAVEMCVRLAGVEICKELKSTNGEPAVDEERLFKSYPFKEYHICNHCHPKIDRPVARLPSLVGMGDSNCDGNADAFAQGSVSASTGACMSKTICRWAQCLCELHAKKKEVTDMPWFASKIKRWPLSDGPDQVCKLYCKCYSGHFHKFLHEIDTANLCNVILKCRQFESWFPGKWPEVSHKVEQAKEVRNDSIAHATKIMVDSRSFNHFAKRIFDFLQSFALSLLTRDDMRFLKDRLKIWDDSKFDKFKRSFVALDVEGAVDWNQGLRTSLQKALDYLRAKKYEVFCRINEIRSSPGDRETLLMCDPITPLSSVCQMLILDVQDFLEIVDELSCFEFLDSNLPVPSPTPVPLPTPAPLQRRNVPFESMETEKLCSCVIH
jgi:hypothetical protein